jgi:hypothetical protein
MKHVTVGKAIDWQQWQLDQSVRSIRFQVDKDNDLYALPVVVIDPTTESVKAAANAWEPFMMGGYLAAVTPSNTAYIQCLLPNGYDIEIDAANFWIAVGAGAADTVEIYFNGTVFGTGSGGIWFTFFANAVPPVSPVVGGTRNAQWIGQTPFRMSTVITASPGSAVNGSIITDATPGNRTCFFNIMGKWRQMA